jgi:1-acyl-sn-glycerol-3-phosphate acyltransferase
MLYRATELIAYPLVRAFFRPVVTGHQHVPKSGAAILAANHLSAADEVFVPVAARRQVAYFAKAEYFSQPGLRGRLVAPTARPSGSSPRAPDHPTVASIGFAPARRGSPSDREPRSSRSDW